MDLQQFFGDRPPPRGDLISVLEHWAEHRGDQLAFAYSDLDSPDQQLTFAQLWSEVRALAAYLQVRCGVKRGDRVLLLYPPSMDFVVGFLACHAAGAIAVPAYPPRRNRKASRIRSIVVDADARWALTTQAQVDLMTTRDQHHDLVGVQLLGTDDPQCRSVGRWRRPKLTADTLAVLQYTSGSTGSPKGVMLSHGNLIANTELILHAFEPNPSAFGMSWLPTYHDMGLIGGVVMPLVIGRPNVQTSPMTFLQRPVRWLQAISRYRVTISGGPNFAYQLCVDKIEAQELEGIDLSSWEIAFNGAEPIRAATLEAFAHRFAPYGFRRSAFLPCYGMAETTLIVTGGPKETRPVIRDFDLRGLVEKRVRPTGEATSESRALVGCGRVLPGETLRIVDPKSHEVLPGDEIGEIWVQSPSVGQGYYQRREETEQVFEAFTADGEGPFLRTGDLGFLYDGQLYVSGRLKDMIVVRGVNRYPQDIEETVERACDVVQAGSVAAFAMDDQHGREQLAIVAECVRVRDIDWDAQIQNIRRAVTEEHELPPDAVYMVRNSSVPKTSSGKIQRHACLHAVRDHELKLVACWVRGEEINRVASAADTQPMMQAASSRALESAPTDINPLIVEVIQDHIKRVAGERAGVLDLDTNIVLDLGLDSLERLEIARNLERTFGGRFPEQVLDEIETLSQIAAAIERYLPPGSETHAAAYLRGDRGTDDTAPIRRNGAVQATRQVAAETDIEQFTEYRRLKATTEQLLMTGVPNPFFTVHEGIVRDTTIIDGTEMISFASYNYLGLSGHPEVIAAASDAIRKYGTSVSASRLVSGEKPIHRQLERRIADWVGVDDAVVMVGGHATNETTIGHLVGADDLILHDSLAHNSIVQGALLSGARRRPFPHNDTRALERTLTELRGQYRRVLIVVEGVYSMDGDYCDLPTLIGIKRKHGALLMVDEAHSFGTMGERGRGIAEFFDVDPKDVDIWMGTLSKSAASCGGYIAGGKPLVELLRYTAPGFVFSVGMPPAQTAAALAAIETMEAEPQRVARLRQRSEYFLSLCRAASLDTGLSESTPVIPVITGNSMVALRLSNRLKSDGINVQPILYPAVDESAARLRFFITSEHSEEQIRFAVERTAHHLAELGISSATVAN